MLSRDRLYLQDLLDYTPFLHLQTNLPNLMSLLNITTPPFALNPYVSISHKHRLIQKG